jgi:regulator of replication initiation timing
MSEEDISSSDESSYKSDSESEFNSSYESFSVSSSSDDSMNESEDEEIFNALQKSVTSFVEDEFISDDDDISGPEEAHDRGDSKCPSISTRSRALVQTLEAENAALRASVVALRSDWEIIVNKMARLQDEDCSTPDEVTDKSPNLDAIRDLRNIAMNALNQKQTQDIIERNKRETDLKSCIECVEELLCENERLYDNIVKLSQEREDILQELDTLRKQAVTSLEESHHSLLANEEVIKSHEDCLDDRATLLKKTKTDLAGDAQNVDNIGDEIMQLLKRVMTQRVDVENSRASSVNAEDTKHAIAEESQAALNSSALVVRRVSSRKSSTSSAHTNNSTRKEDIDTSDECSTRKNSACNSHHSRRRSARSDSDCSRRRSSYYSETSGSEDQHDFYSDSSRPEGESDFSSDSESEEEEERRGESNIIHASMNSLFDGNGPSFSSSQDIDDHSAPDLDPIYENHDDSSESESSCEDDFRRRTPSPMCPKKKSWYNAVRSVASRIKGKDIRRKPKYYYTAEDEDGITRETESRRSSDNTLMTDIELTHYPEVSSRCSPSSSSRSSSRSSSSSMRASRNERHFSASFTSVPEDREMPLDEDMHCSTSFTSIQDDHEVSLNDDNSQQYSKNPNPRHSSQEQEEDDDPKSCKSEYNDSNFSIGTPVPRDEKGQDLGTSYLTQSPGNIPSNFVIKPRRTVSTCASVSHGDSEFDDATVAESCATSSSESTKERKGISITVVSRSSRFLTLPSSRSHTYMTFFTASLLKNQIDEVLYEQYHESMKEILGSMSSVATEVASGAKRRKNQKYQGDLSEDGQRHGYGIYKSKNGNEYRGEWHNNKREGLGVVKIGNGDVFEGQFLNNMKNGIGVYHYIDGECDLSRYEDDRRIGESLRYTKDRKKAYLLSEDFSSKEISIDDAAFQARLMGVIIQL